MSKSKKTNEVIENNLSTFVGSIAQQQNNLFAAPVSRSSTLYYNTRNFLVTLDRNLLANLYVELGIVQTLIDQPVEDAFRAGFEIKTSQLDADDIEEIEAHLERGNIIQELAQAIKWGRLFGGGGLMVINDDKPDIPLDISKIKKGGKLTFKAVDRWELLNLESKSYDPSYTQIEPEFYNYYGHIVHSSRIMAFRGKEPPPFLRPRFQGWGMSEIEKVVRSLNQFLKNQDVVFELLDEAKVDVFKINGFNSSLLSSSASNTVANRVQMGNALKNFVNALVMDKNDEYEQKSVNFAGLGEMLVQIRQNLAADLKMPMTKLFGISAAGFNSGEDDIENYNSMIESEIRSKVKYILHDVLSIIMLNKMGIVPDDLKIEFNPLRILSAEQEEKVKDSQFNRVMSAYQSGLATAQEAKEGINKDALMPTELDETTDGLEPLERPDNFQTKTTPSI